MNLSRPTYVKNLQAAKIGLMADSHGSSETIEQAITFFRDQNCGPIYHLGDICDSHRPETADGCVQILRENEILAIKGNNDYAILLNRDPKLIKETTHQYLEALPLIREQDEAILVHSLPFVEELGLSAMIGLMRKRVARRFFKEYDHRVLFRGHSHSPQIIRPVAEEIVKMPLSPGQRINLQQSRPCIITCGALTEGLCLIWNQAESSLECLSFLTYNK